MSLLPLDQPLGGLAHQVSCIWRNHTIAATRGQFLWREIEARREMWDRHWLIRGALDERLADFTGFQMLVNPGAPAPLPAAVDHLTATD